MRQPACAVAPLPCPRQSLPTASRRKAGWYALLTLLAPGLAVAAADSTNFDLDVLRSRGIDPSMAAYFSQAPRFSPGQQTVTVFINGEKKGSALARFDAQGELCFDSPFLDKVGLLLPEEQAASAVAAPGSCYDYRQAYAQTLVELQPSAMTIKLLVPSEALRLEEQASTGVYTNGGTAALLNYDAQNFQVRFPGRSSQSRNLDLELGLNSHDWIFRSRQGYFAQDGLAQWNHMYAYAQRSFVDSKSQLQLGQINVASPLLSAPTLYGFQVVPEDALARPPGVDAGVQGIAHSQARVEVRQGASLIYSTLVPPGPFTLSHMPLVSGQSDLEVTVIESDGERRSFVIPATALDNAGSRPVGASFALGRVQDDAGSGQAPWVATAAGTWMLDGATRMSTAGLVGDAYLSTGLGVDRQLSSAVTLSAKTVVTNSPEQGKRGLQNSAVLNARLSDTLSASLSASQRTLGYRDLMEAQSATAVADDGRYRDQYSAAVSYANPLIGGVSLAYSRSQVYGGQPSQRLMTSWSRSFGEASLSVSFERGLGDAKDNAAYLNLSFPLGSRQSLSSYASSSSSGVRFGTGTSGELNQYARYGLSAEQQQDGEKSYSGRLDLLPRYAQAALSYSQNGGGGSSQGMSLRGGLVAHSNGVTLSPYPVNDTFGLVKTGDLGGTKLQTNSGPVWTDAWGWAVAPSLSAYGNSRLEVSAKDLPRNVEVRNGFRSVDAGRGSVNMLDFDLVRTRRALLHATLPDGSDLPKGAMVLDAQGNFVGVAGERGSLFIGDAEGAPELNVQLGDGTRCTLNYQLAEEADPEQFFEAADAVCQPLAAPIAAIAASIEKGA